MLFSLIRNQVIRKLQSVRTSNLTTHDSTSARLVEPRTPGNPSYLRLCRTVHSQHSPSSGSVSHGFKHERNHQYRVWRREIIGIKARLNFFTNERMKDGFKLYACRG